MEIMYLNEHKGCFNFDNKKNASINKIILKKDEIWETDSNVNKIIFVVDGKLNYSKENYENIEISKKEFMFLPSKEKLTGYAKEDGTLLLIFNLYKLIDLCHTFSLKNLEKHHLSSYQKRKKAKPMHLQTIDIISEYLNLLIKCFDANLKCKYFFDIKIEELMFFLRGFYKKEIMADFFKNASSETDFYQFVIRNYNKYRSLAEISSAINYTVSGFEKRFRREFKCSPYKWMKDMKAHDIYNKIVTSDLNYKEISSVFQFSSVPQFFDFVKNYFGKTPKQIRENL